MDRIPTAWCGPHQFDIVVYKRAYAASIVGILRSALPEGTGEVATGECQRGHLALGTAV